MKTVFLQFIDRTLSGTSVVIYSQTLKGGTGSVGAEGSYRFIGSG